MRPTPLWLALVALAGCAGQGAVAPPSSGPDDLYMSMPSPSLLLSRYIVFRRHVTQVRPNVVICVREFSKDDAEYAMAAGWATSVRVDTTCKAPTTVADGAPPVLVIERVIFGSDTSRAIATYHQDRYPRSWREEFVWFRPPLPGDWHLVIGQFALPD